MNLAITPAMTAPVKGGGGNTAAGAGAKGTGFAGALVQALGGTGTQQPNAGATALPIAYMSLLMQGGESGANQTGDVVMSLLNNLIRQLGQKQDDKNAAGSPNDGWAQLLAGLQALLAQLLSGAQPQDDSPVSPTEPGKSSDSSTDTGASPAIASILALLAPALQSALQQLGAGDQPSTDPATAQASAEGTAAPALSANTASQAATALLPLVPALQTALQQLAATPGITGDQQTAAGALLERLSAIGPAQSAQAQDDKAAPVTLQATDPLQTSRNAAQQPEIAVVQTESRPSVAAFKEPIVHWQFAQAENAQAAEPAAVPSAGDAQQTGDHSATLPWTMPAQQQAAAMQQAPAATLPQQVPVRQFAEQVGPYLVRQFVLSGGNGITEAKLTLHPEQLGQVDVRIVMQDGQMTAQFVAHNSSAKELLENQMGMLRTALQNQGIDVDRMDVLQQPDWSASTAFQGQEQRHSGSQHGGDSDNGSGGSYEDQTDFEEELARTSALREAGYGGALNVTA